MTELPQRLRVLWDLAPGDELLGYWDLLPGQAGLQTASHLSLKRSFGTVIFELDDSVQGQVIFIVNGLEIKPRKIGSCYQLRIELKLDIQFCRIIILVDSCYSLTLDVVVVHEYLLGDDRVVKWSFDEYLNELRKHRALLSSAKQAVRLPREVAVRLSGSSSGELDSLLIQLTGRLLALLQAASTEEWLADFPGRGAGDLDRAKILRDLKRDPSHLYPDPEGSILVSGVRYTTDLGHRRHVRSSRPDYGIVEAALLYCLSLCLKTYSVPAVAMSFLRAALTIVHGEIRRPGNEYDLGDFLDLTMSSRFGVSLRELVTLVVAILTEKATTTEIDGTFLDLTEAIQDRDVFQMSVFAACARAMGFTPSEILESRGVLHRSRDGVYVVDANRQEGNAIFRRYTTSWRQNSKQSSDFRPDTCVIINSRPVLIDAKFRLPPSKNMVASSGGLKDVQAYMNDLDLNSAVVVVPRLLSSPEGIEEITGRGNAIYVVELRDSDNPQTIANLRAAIVKAAGVRGVRSKSSRRARFSKVSLISSPVSPNRRIRF